MSLVDLLLEIRDKEIKYFENYLEYAKKIKNSAREILSDSGLRVLIFGSIVRGNYLVGRSDIDILIISNNVPNSLREQTKIRIEILRKLGDYFAPFEIHFATKEIFEKWYRGFIKNDYIEV